MEPTPIKSYEVSTSGQIDEIGYGVFPASIPL